MRAKIQYYLRFIFGFSQSEIYGLYSLFLLLLASSFANSLDQVIDSIKRYSNSSYNEIQNRKIKGFYMEIKRNFAQK